MDRCGHTYMSPVEKASASRLLSWGEPISIARMPKSHWVFYYDSGAFSEIKVAENVFFHCSANEESDPQPMKHQKSRGMLVCRKTAR